MKLSAPIFRLKRQAKLLSKERGIPLHEALDRMAVGEGFQRWSQLAAHYDESQTARKILGRIDDGDLLLLAAPREHGKTTLAFELMAAAVKDGHRSLYFTLSESADDIRRRSAAVGMQGARATALFAYDTSEDICAAYIIDKMKAARPGTLIVIDYLQILDQQRRKAALADQVIALKDFALSTGAIVLIISQINRGFDTSAKTLPGIRDVPLPNPLDLGLFTKACFLNDGELRFGGAA